jgi:hypothetical protein
MIPHMRKGHLRGLADLQTVAGLKAREVAPHAAYMKITSLELEKLRLDRVRRDALRRIAEIDARYEDIRAEKAKLTAAIARATAAAPGSSQPTGHTAGLNGRRTRGLSLRY